MIAEKISTKEKINGIFFVFIVNKIKS